MPVERLPLVSGTTTVKQGKQMSIFLKFRLVILAFLSLGLSACITWPGYRHTIDQENFYLHITASSRAINKEIRFNAEETELLFLPESAQIELVVTDNIGKRQLTIKEHQGSIVYHYRLNGRKTTFGAKEREWFASQVPLIIEKSKYRDGPSQA
ncbi:hypothetical protein [Rheinheimera baltica]|uniref:hypothetical protein n=1 Tax=Rheinheimera baltica TaxID=67576 RepID=UPI00273D1365|nr:hypothetical protein [Rheinheimera baltica]MDP5148858.1 hypothetical protein [Rheinheimera baltica]